MTKYYTHTVSKELLEALIKKGFPVQRIPIGYNYFEEGGGYPEYGTVFPTYAEVLDWLISKDVFICIDKGADNNYTTYLDVLPFTEFYESSLLKALDNVILLAIDFEEHDV